MPAPTAAVAAANATAEPAAEERERDSKRRRREEVGLCAKKTRRMLRAHVLVRAAHVACWNMHWYALKTCP